MMQPRNPDDDLMAELKRDERDRLFSQGTEPVEDYNPPRAPEERVLNRAQRRRRERREKLERRRREARERRMTVTIHAAMDSHRDIVIITRRTDLPPTAVEWSRGGEAGGMGVRWYRDTHGRYESAVIEYISARDGPEVEALSLYVAQGMGTVSTEIARLVVDAIDACAVR